MHRRTQFALVALALVTGGSLLISGGYAWYWRSDAYRDYCAKVLSDSLGLESEIGAVVPRSRSAREFRDVRIWLPERRGRAAYCEQALLRRDPVPEAPGAYELQLRGGSSEISTRTWLRKDYRLVLESGLRPGFDPDGPRRVTFSEMDLTFERNRFRAALEDAAGALSFEDPHHGTARVSCRRFNGYQADEPVTFQADFSPQARGVQLDRVCLDVPELPIARVALDALVGLPLDTGTFSGKLEYRERGAHQSLTVRGRLRDIRLVEITVPFLDRPWRGRAPELQLDELSVVAGRVERVRCHSLFTDVELADVLALWDLDGVGGRLNRLYIDVAELSPAGIDRLVVSGQCDDIALAEVAAALGWGGMTGRARLVLSDLTIMNNALTSLDIEIRVYPVEGADNYIERALLVEVLRRTGVVQLPDAVAGLLPERFPYAELGIRFEVRDEMLHVFGTHGPGEKTILSAAVGGQTWPVLQEPEESYDLTASLDAVRGALRRWVEAHLATTSPRDAWRALSPRAGGGAQGPVE